MWALSAAPWGRVAAAGARVGGGLIVALGGSCSEIRFRPLNSEPGTSREAERDQGEFTRIGSSQHEFLRVEVMGRDSAG